MTLSVFELEIDPTQDGVDHIRVGVHGKTMLGRMLSSLYHLPFNHPQHGQFESIEAYWHWARSGMKHDELRALHGQKASDAGGRYLSIHRDGFRRIIVEGIEQQIMQNKVLRDHLLMSDLPLIEYDRDNAGMCSLEKNHDWYFKAVAVIRSRIRKSLPRKTRCHATT